MELYDYFESMEPMKYWCPTKGSTLIDDIFENPTRYSEYIGMQKYDGEWCLAMKSQGKILFRSRSISKVTGKYGDKTELVPHLVESLSNMPDGTVLLGELCYEDVAKTSKDVGAILRCKPAKAIERQAKEKLHFVVFDCLAYDNNLFLDKCFEDRITFINHKLDENPLPYFKRIKVFPCDEKLPETIQQIWKTGGEGAVLVKRNALYSPGLRPARLSIKVKKNLNNIELPVVNYLLPNREYEGKESDNWPYWENGVPVTRPYALGWAVGVEVDNKGTKIKVTSGLTNEDKEWLRTEDGIKAIQSGDLYAVVSGMEMLESGSIRHPQLISLRRKETM